MKLHLKFDTTNLISQKQFCKYNLRLDQLTSYGQIKLLVEPIFVHLGLGIFFRNVCVGVCGHVHVHFAFVYNIKAVERLGTI